MRPNLVLTAVVLVLLLMTAAAFGQQPFPCAYGCGPYVPLLTTPMMSLQQASPNPVGASNATTGLIAGATNSSLSQLQGSTSSTYTEPVWNQGGGAPAIASDVHIHPDTIGREGHLTRDMRGVTPMNLNEERAREERAPRQEARAGWTYYSGHERTGSPAAAAAANGSKGAVKAGHVYTNDDITRQNDKNGNVKYDDKTEKLQ
jgi:hypothetical protein